MKNTKKLEKYDLRKLSPKIYREFFISLVIFMIPVALFTYLAKEVFENETLAIDTAILKFINAKSLPILDRTVPWITKGSGGIVIGSFFILICIYYYFKKEFHNIIFLTLTLPGTSILNTVLKLIFKRERPNLWNLLVKETFYSFPSGHAMISTALVLSIIIICYHTKYFKPSLIIGIIFIVIIGFTRLYLGVHYPTDILAGWLVSGAWVYLCTKIMMRNTAFKKDFLEEVL